MTIGKPLCQSLAAMLLGLITSGQVLGANFTVDTLSDFVDNNVGDGVCATTGNLCTLRAAIQEANANPDDEDLIVFNQPGEIVLNYGAAGEDQSAAGDLDILGPVRIAGYSSIFQPNLSNLTTINGNAGDRIFDLQGNVRVELSDLVITNGKVSDANGGAVRVNSSGGRLYLTQVIVSNSVAHNPSQIGSGFSGGGIYANGALYIDRSEIRDNQADGGVGITAFRELFITDTLISGNTDANSGTLSAGNGTGLLVEWNSSLTGQLPAALNRVTIENNTGAYSGGGLFSARDIYIAYSVIRANSSGAWGGGAEVYRNLYMVGTEISDNTSANGAGLDFTSSLTETAMIDGSLFKGNTASGNGGGLYASEGITITNSTFSANQADNGGAVYHYFLTGVNETSSYKNVTFSANVASTQGAAIFSQDANVNVQNSILQGSTNSNCGGSVASQGYNIDDDNSCGFTVTGDQNVNPQLAALADNGGPTFTHALLTGSPALDKGLSGCSAYDQRGLLRDANCDVGAFEAGATAVSNSTGPDSTVYSVSEADSELVITFQRYSGSQGPITIRYVSGYGSATPGQDYDAVSGELSWADGDTSDKQITVTLQPDSIKEADEDFYIYLVNPQGTDLGKEVPVHVTILDDDTHPGAFAFAQAGYSFDESAGQVSLTVQRLGGTDGAVQVDYNIDNNGTTAVNGTDFTLTEGSLSFADGESNKTISLDIIDDTLYESPDKVLVLSLSNPSDGSSLGTQSSTTITINDNDRQAGEINFAQAAMTVDEHAGIVTVTVERSNGADGDVSVNFVNNTGTADQVSTALQVVDYNTSFGTLSFADGETSQTFEISIVDDTIDEPTEKIVIALNFPQGGVQLGSQKLFTLTITDNDLSDAGNSGGTPPPATGGDSGGGQTGGDGSGGGDTGGGGGGGSLAWWMLVLLLAEKFRLNGTKRRLD
jgi:CSLREA domain-containing protein